MNLIAWILFGIIVGIINHGFSSSSSHKGLLSSIVIGVIGSIIGGFFATLLFGLRITGFAIPSFLIAALFSLGLFFFFPLLRRLRL